ncbi:hypothetical protein M3J09_009633 [Ascochyta lentis]
MVSSTCSTGCRSKKLCRWGLALLAHLHLHQPHLTGDRNGDCETVVLDSWRNMIYRLQSCKIWTTDGFVCQAFHFVCGEVKTNVRQALESFYFQSSTELQNGCFSLFLRQIYHVNLAGIEDDCHRGCAALISCIDENADQDLIYPATKATPRQLSHRSQSTQHTKGPDIAQNRNASDTAPTHHTQHAACATKACPSLYQSLPNITPTKAHTPHACHATHNPLQAPARPQKESPHLRPRSLHSHGRAQSAERRS